MKIIKYLSVLSLAVALCLVGCSKTGPAGPQGERGSAGVQGIPGADGSIIYSGNGEPGTDTGKNGDYYLDKDTGNLYGPKTDKGWGTPISLKGPKGEVGPQGPQGDPGPQGSKGDPGQDGKDGGRILSGTSVPTSAVGNIGDYYWDISSFTLYGPKTASGWGSGVVLRGPQGPQGIPGADGSIIYSGNGKPGIDIGKSGDYYLDKDTGNLYGPKTDEGWGTPISLKGPKGDKGDPGQDGKDGIQILSGTSPPTSDVGKIGDYYWDVSSFTLYGPKTSSGWGSGIVLRGPKGDPGTANVMYSDWLKFTWGNSFPNEDLMYIKEPKITLDFINNGGTILSYLLFFQTSGSDTLTAVMYSIPQAIRSNAIGYVAGQKFNFAVAYHAAHSPTNIILDVTAEGTLPPHFLQDFLFIPDPVNPIYNRYRFRYILIPGGVHLPGSAPPPDPEDYEAMRQYYGIPE